MDTKMLLDLDKLSAVVEAIDTEVDMGARKDVLTGLVLLAKDLIDTITKRAETAEIRRRRGIRTE